MKEFDNITYKLGEDLKQVLTNGAKVSIAAKRFSLYAYQALQAELDKVDCFNFIFSPAQAEDVFMGKARNKSSREFHLLQPEAGSVFDAEVEIKLKNQLSQKAIAKECVNWIKQKACFKANLSSKNIPNFFNMLNTEGGVTYTGAEEFTTADLGYGKSNDWYAITK